MCSHHSSENFDCNASRAKAKKIDINVPKLDDFIHKVYINVARKVYKNVYLFELNIPPLQTQKNNRELEVLVQEGILNTLRESVPVEAILKAYMDETVEEDVVEEVNEQIMDEPIAQHDKSNENTSDKPDENRASKLSFNNTDYVSDESNNVTSVSAPKDIPRLEEISKIRAEQRRLENESDEDDENESSNVKLSISDQSFDLGTLDLHNIEEPKMDLLPDLLLDEIEVLD